MWFWKWQAPKRRASWFLFFINVFIRKMPPRCEFRQPHCFPVVAWHVERSSSQDEKPVWCRGALRVSGEVCILPQPAQAVVQTRTLNEAWSRRPFGGMLQGEFLWSHCLFLCRDFQPTILLRLPLPHSQTFKFFLLFHRVSHLSLHLARWSNPAFYCLAGDLSGRRLQSCRWPKEGAVAKWRRVQAARLWCEVNKT